MQREEGLQYSTPPQVQLSCVAGHEEGHTETTADWLP